MMLMKAANYDKSMMDAAKREEEARNEGEIAGRNANIRHKQEKEYQGGSVAARSGFQRGDDISHEKGEKPDD